MATTATARQRLVQCALWGAAGFGIGLGVVSAFVGGIDAVFHIPDFDAGIRIGTLAYGIAGGFGGAIIASSMASQKNIAALALAGASGLGVGFLFTSIIDSVFIEPRITGYAAFAAVAMLEFALIGGWTGLLLGAVQRNWKYVWLVVLAGAIGFGLASLAQALAGAALGRIFATPNAVANAIGFGTQGAIGGIIGGAFLGAALWQSSRSSI